ncbi:MAG: aldo/keto reductase [Oscillospiraceae bacterium]|nr:aldo/keto reductase [Oscillospiraceae bacterium]
MLYKQFGDIQLSHLGMGNMRLPTIGERGPIDEEKARKVIEYAYNNGVNYFDTAFRYHEGESETFTGKILNQFPRDTWNLASKFPGHMLRKEGERLVFTGFGEGRLEYFDSIEQIFELQLEKCKVDYFDFYLLHGLAENSYDFYSDKGLGIVDFFQKQREAGRIKHFGFSSHGRAESIEMYLNEWKGVFEFVQIQINYLDWTLQNAKEKYEIITNSGLHAVAMEPVRGGRLARLPAEAEALLKEARPDDSPATWALRYLQGLPGKGMTVILSGMTEMEHVIENVAVMSKNEPTTQDENVVLEKVVALMTNMIPCTACRYCEESCPQSLNISRLISMYNEASYDGRIGSAMTILEQMGEDGGPSACIACRECEKLCPQEIAIPDILEKFVQMIANSPPGR